MQIYADVYTKMAFAIYAKNNMYRKSHFSIYDLIPEIYSGGRVTHGKARVVFSDQNFPILQKELVERICCSEKT